MNKADIDYSGKYVIVWDKNGNVIFKMENTPQYRALASDIYIGEKCYDYFKKEEQKKGAKKGKRK